MRLFVADYKAAGAQYLSCVKAANKAVDGYTAGLSWTASRTVDKKYVRGLAHQIECLKNYSWPPSVAALAKDLAQQEAVVYDATKRAIAAKTSVAYYAAFGADWQSASDKGGSDAAKIRRGLGLPARNG